MRSTVTGLSMVVLCAPAGDAFPAAPSLSRLLNDPQRRTLAVDAVADRRILRLQVT